MFVWERLIADVCQGPTIFPILFAAIASKFLRALAATKLERGASVLTLDNLLNSRTVFSTLTTPFELRTLNIVTPLLVLLWALSPLGGQASLRVISTGPSYTNTTGNFTYLAFVSPFTNQGVGSASAEPLAPIDAAFTAALATAPDSKASPQDQFGNIKVPVYEYLNSSSSKDGSTWREVPDNDNITWSSLTGLPLHGLPSKGTSRFQLNTGYMMTDCRVSGRNWTAGYMQSLENVTYWSGANFAFNASIGFDAFQPASFNFLSLSLEGGSPSKPLTSALCNLSMSYLELQVQCEGKSCRSLAVRPSASPATHSNRTTNPTSLSSTQFTPLNGLGQRDIMFTSFMKNFVNSTNPSVGCDTSFCTTSAIEGYLANPDSPYNFPFGNPSLWTYGNKLISQRFTQLFNTYWIDSIAPFAVAGQFNISVGLTDPTDQTVTDRYNVDSSIGTIEREEIVVKCNYAWLAMLLLASTVLLLIGLVTVVLNMFRRGPSILDSFSSLLRDSPYAASIPHSSSMEDGFHKSKRLRNVKVRLGDVRPDEDVGYVALAALDGRNPVKRLSTRRVYA